MFALSEEDDLALLQVQGLPPETPYLLLADRDRVTETTPIVVAGFPFGELLDRGDAAPRVTIVTGTVSSLRHSPEGVLERIQIDADINPGNSGGPVLDYSGRAVGVVVETILTTNISFVIPISAVHWLLSGRIVVTEVDASRWKATGSAYVHLEVDDPIGRIEEVGVNVAPNRRGSSTPPEPRSSDGLIGVTVARTSRLDSGVIEAPISDSQGTRVWVQAWYADQHGINSLEPVEVHLGRNSQKKQIWTPTWEEQDPLSRNRGTSQSYLKGVCNIVLAPDGDRVWALHPEDQTVLEIDLDHFTLLDELGVPSDAVAMSLTPDGSRLWVASNERPYTILTEVSQPLRIEKSFFRANACDLHCGDGPRRRGHRRGRDHGCRCGSRADPGQGPSVPHERHGSASRSGSRLRALLGKGLPHRALLS